MEITLNITEDSKVELVKDSCEAVQGENNVTVLNINLPSTIKGYSIDNYTKQIEFGECKELGECKKFLDVLEGNTYKLCSTCTQFNKLMIQFTLTNLVDEDEPIVWKTIPFALEFCESINAENTKETQVSLLSLAEILTEWENYIKDNTFRVISKVEDMPTADATNLGKTIFYLHANTTSPYTLTYGHYYRCNYVNGAYEWTDLTQDPNLADVANGIREINHDRTIQKWVGTKEEYQALEDIQENTFYIITDDTTLSDLQLALSDINNRKKLVFTGNNIDASENTVIGTHNIDNFTNKDIVVEIYGINGLYENADLIVKKSNNRGNSCNITCNKTEIRAGINDGQAFLSGQTFYVTLEANKNITVTSANTVDISFHGTTISSCHTRNYETSVAFEKIKIYVIEPIN